MNWNQSLVILNDSLSFYLFISISKDELQEDKLNESDNSPKNLSTPTSKRFKNLIFVDENLTDEDAWMCILEVVNAEVWISIEFIRNSICFSL